MSDKNELFTLKTADELNVGDVVLVKEDDYEMYNRETVERKRIRKSSQFDDGRAVEIKFVNCLAAQFATDDEFIVLKTQTQG